LVFTPGRIGWRARWAAFGVRPQKETTHMFPQLPLAMLLASGMLAASSEDRTDQACCAKHAWCCTVKAACCKAAPLGDPLPLSASGGPACCAKRAGCCAERRACCDTPNARLLEAAAESSPGAPAAPTCCDKHAWCCTVKAACCKAAPLGEAFLLSASGGPTCCDKHAWCCTEQRACCRRR
jgi:hypothetical protein